jgi:hypothetical protein
MQAIALAEGRDHHPGVEVSEHDYCGRCGRELTDPDSIELGIGPECERKIGGTGERRSRVANREMTGRKANRLTREHAAGAHSIHIPGCPTCEAAKAYTISNDDERAAAVFDLNQLRRLSSLQPRYGGLEGRERDEAIREAEEIERAIVAYDKAEKTDAAERAREFDAMSACDDCGTHAPLVGGRCPSCRSKASHGNGPRTAAQDAADGVDVFGEPTGWEILNNLAAV